MNGPILHIGYHKTGTSWFQKSLYPSVTNAVYLDRRKVRDAFLNTTAFSFDIEHARRLLACDGRPIICEEGLTGYFGNAGLLEALSKDVASRLHAVYPKGEVVIFIRHQLEAIRANYLQYVRGGGTRSLKRFLFPYAYERDYANRWHKKPLFSLERFAYSRLIDHYRQVFGSRQVHVFCYEEFAADPRSFAASFAETFGLDADVRTLDFGRRNQTFGLFTLQLARLFGPFTRWDTPDRLVLLPLLPKWLHKGGLGLLDRTPLRGPVVTAERLLDSKLAADLATRYAPDNAYLARELGLPLADHGYPLP